MIINILTAALALASPVHEARLDQDGTAAALTPTVERARYLMGSSCRIAASHPVPGRAASLVEAAFREIDHWEKILSDYDPGSELSRLNGRPGGTSSISRELALFIRESRGFSDATDGAFDLTVGPLVDLYRLRDGGRWPAADEIRDALEAVGYGKLRLSTDEAGHSTVNLASGAMRLDPGAVGKGFALDRAAEILRKGGVDWALLDFGRQIAAVGAGPDGCGFKVDLDLQGEGAMTVALRDASISTTANSERGLVVDGRPLGHLLDPRTGLPAGSARRSVVIAPSASAADAFSTALFVLGPREGTAAADAAGLSGMVWPAGGEEPKATAGFELHLAGLCPAGNRAPEPRTLASGSQQ